MSKDAKQVRTEIIIQAAPSVVWEILTDFENYSQWNPFIKSVKGKATEGTRITARIEPPGASGMTFKPMLLSVQKNQELRWLGHLFFPGLFDGEHIFELYENTDGSTTFVQREIFTGILVPLFAKMLDVNTVKGFELMNAKIKAIAEGEARSGAGKSSSENLRTLTLSLAIILFLSFGNGVVAQDRLSGKEISLNFFRNPSVGLEYRVNHISVHAGYYPTNFTSGVTTSFIRSGLTYWFLPVGRKQHPSSFYSSVSYVRGFDRDYEDKNGGMLEGGFRWIVLKGLNVRLGVTALVAPGEDLKINPTPGISYSFFLK